MGITVVGLGPGDGRLLTREAWELLSNASELYVRTARHPAVDDLPEDLTVHSFDHIYDQSEKFEDVYSEIVSALIEKANVSPLIYAVPGNPFMGESTVLMLQKEARAQQIELRVVAGLSYIEPCLAAVGVDGMEGLQLHDALTIAGQDYPQVNGDHPLLIGQVFSRLMASDLKERLTMIYPDEHPAYLVHSAGMPDQKVEEISLFEIDHSDSINHLSSLYLPPLRQKSDMVALAEAIATLRAPGGCPWDQKQTPQSMRDGFLEEACEVLDAIDRDEPADICEELGDVLLHVTMQAQMASEVGDFTLSDVIAGIYAKIIRRHPHVWGTTDVDGSDQVVANWEAIKAQEKAAAGKPVDDSLLTNIPVALPALARSQKIQKRVRKAGFDWPDIQGVYDKLQEEVEEVQTATTQSHRLEELGDLLFVTVNLASWLGVDAEIALREANLKFENRFRALEEAAKERNINLKESNIDELDLLWNLAKERVG